MTSKIKTIIFCNSTLILVQVIGIFISYSLGLSTDELVKILPTIISTTLTLCLTFSIYLSNIIQENYINFDSTTRLIELDIETRFFVNNNTSSSIVIENILIDYFETEDTNEIPLIEKKQCCEFVMIFKNIIEPNDTESHVKITSQKYLKTKILFRNHGEKMLKAYNIEIKNPLYTGTL